MQLETELRAESKEEPAKTVQESSDTKDPIERLRKRSALERWKKLTAGWKKRPESSDSTKNEVPVEQTAPVRRLSPLNLSSSEESTLLGPRIEAVESSSSSPVPKVFESDLAKKTPETETSESEPSEKSSKWRKSEAKTPAVAKEGIKEPLFKTASLNRQPLQVQGPLKGETPTEIKKITEISPFADYEPDPELAETDPCRNQCPRPDGLCDSSDENDRLTVCPELTPLSEEPYQPRQIPSSLYAWEAPNLYHNPLYFEDPQLERYGHTYNEVFQPFVSVGKFGVQLVGLPYQMTIDPVCKRKYTLGWYRPGECAPKKHYQIPFNCDAAAVQAAAATGIIFLVP